MSQKEDLINKLKLLPKNFTIDELDSLMKKCGCKKSTRGRTSGSAIAYVHIKTNRIFKIHSPHPQKEIKQYAVKAATSFLELIGEI